MNMKNFTVGPQNGDILLRRKSKICYRSKQNIFERKVFASGLGHHIDSRRLYAMFPHFGHILVCDGYRDGPLAVAFSRLLPRSFATSAHLNLLGSPEIEPFVFTNGSPGGVTVMTFTHTPSLIK